MHKELLSMGQQFSPLSTSRIPGSLGASPQLGALLSLLGPTAQLQQTHKTKTRVCRFYPAGAPGRMLKLVSQNLAMNRRGLTAEAPNTHERSHHCRQRCNADQAAAMVQALVSNAAASLAELNIVAVHTPAITPLTLHLSIESCA